MRQRFVRAAIRVYPPRWRRRYGAELEQLVLDAAAGRGVSLRDDAQTVGSLLRAGLAEWLRPIGPRTQIALLTVIAGLACLMINAVEIGTEIKYQGIAIPGQITLAGDVIVGSGVDVIHSRTVRIGPGSGGAGRPTLVTLEPGAGGISSISGAPTRVFMDPKSGTVLAISRRFAGGAHSITLAQWVAMVKRERRELQLRQAAADAKPKPPIHVQAQSGCPDASTRHGSSLATALWPAFCG